MAALVPADGVARLDAGDLNVIDTFFGRALDLDLEKRAEIAAKIADRMSAKMQVPLPEGRGAGAGAGVDCLRDAHGAVGRVGSSSCRHRAGGYPPIARVYVIWMQWLTGRDCL